MLPAIEKVLEQGGIWSIEIVGLEATMSSDLKQYSQNNPEKVKVTFLNVEDFCFIQMKKTRKQGDQKPLDADRLPFDFGDMDVHANGILLDGCRIDDIEWLQAKIPKWPFCYQKQLVSMPDNTDKTNVLIVLMSSNDPENTDLSQGIRFVLNTLKNQLTEEHCRKICTYASARCTSNTNPTEVAISNSFVPKLVESPVKKEGAWEQVRRTKSNKNKGKTSFPCRYHFLCRKKLKCTYKHTPEEEEFFKSGKKAKTRSCYYLLNCRRVECDFAHFPEESFCTTCNLRGHLSENCSLKKDTAKKI